MNQIFTTYEGRGEVLKTIGKMLRSADCYVADRGFLRAGDIATAADGVPLAKLGTGKSGGDLNKFFALVDATIKAKLPAAQEEMRVHDMARRYAPGKDFRLSRPPGHFEGFEFTARADARREMKAITFLAHLQMICNAAMVCRRCNDTGVVPDESYCFFEPDVFDLMPCPDCAKSAPVSVCEIVEPIPF